MKTSFRSARRVPAEALAAAALLCAAALAAPARAAGEHETGFYAGIGAGSLHQDGRYSGISYQDRSSGPSVFGGYRLRGYLAIELAVERFDGLRARDVAGSGTDRLDISGTLNAAIARAVATVPLSDLLHWHRRIRLIGGFGYGVTELHRDVVELNSGTRVSALERTDGTTFGVGALYGLPKVDLRGYVERLDANHALSSTTLSLAVELKF